MAMQTTSTETPGCQPSNAANPLADAAANRRRVRFLRVEAESDESESMRLPEEEEGDEEEPLAEAGALIDPLIGRYIDC